MSSVKPVLIYLLPCLAIWPDAIKNDTAVNQNNPLLNMIIIILLNLCQHNKSN